MTRRPQGVAGVSGQRREVYDGRSGNGRGQGRDRCDALAA
jgi:hypothetical protein